jgi:polar amino acid transport system substrate-binding protein
MQRLLFCLLIILIAVGLALPGCAVPTKIRVAVAANWPPFEQVNQTTKDIEGLDIDLMNAIARKTNLQVEYINLGFDQIIAGMAQCQYDAAISSITITEERKKNMMFSDPYFAAGQIVVVRKESTVILGKDSLGGKKVGVQAGTVGAAEAAKIQGAIIKPYDNAGLAYQDLLNSQLDAVITDNPIALTYVGKFPARIKTTGVIFTSEYYGIALCQNNKELLGKINEGLKSVMNEGLISKLTTKWLGEQ